MFNLEDITIVSYELSSTVAMPNTKSRRVAVISGDGHEKEAHELRQKWFDEQPKPVFALGFFPFTGEYLIRRHGEIWLRGGKCPEDKSLFENLVEKLNSEWSLD